MPDQWNSCIVNCIARMGADIVHIKWVTILGPISIRIDPTIKWVFFWGHYKSPITSRKQVHANSEDCFHMTCSWIDAKSCTLMHGIANIWSGRFFQKVQLANNTVVLPGSWVSQQVFITVQNDIGLIGICLGLAFFLLPLINFKSGSMESINWGCDRANVPSNCLLNWTPRKSLIVPSIVMLNDFLSSSANFCTAPTSW